jgi:hypothetical protein
MMPVRSNLRWFWVSIPGLVAVAALSAVFALRSPRSGSAEPAPAYSPVALPERLDSLSRLEDAARRIATCGADCAELVYVWTARMPLSRAGIPNIERAARRAGARLTLVRFEELERYAETGVEEPAVASLADELLGAGSLTHAPSLAVHDGTGVVGPAILGYKSEEAYASVIERRLSGDFTPASSSDALPVPDVGRAAVVAYTDFEAIGVPGAYFKWVPGRRAIAYESGGRIYLLDLQDGEHSVGPGYVDFIPTPDGDYFVTPGPQSSGLAFYDADAVFEGARRGRAGRVRPIFVDGEMRDQYPSVGILGRDEASIRYRILTSWFEGLVYRDYEVRHATNGSPATVRPIAPPVVPCSEMGLSTPIMSQDGLEVAARDEASGSTKILRFGESGRCEEVLDLGMPTRKVAWHPNGRKLAFSTPRVRTRGSGGVEPGIFTYDRDGRSITRVTGSDGASQLAFPDFVRDDAIVFMIPGRPNGQPSLFRIVEPLP